MHFFIIHRLPSSIARLLALLKSKRTVTRHIDLQSKVIPTKWQWSWNKQNESGQALVMGLLLLIASWLAALGCIRLARMLAEDVHMTNANDAAAYSTGILHARLLNYDAYINRALINNEIAIAQWISLGSVAKTAEMSAQYHANASFAATHSTDLILSEQRMQQEGLSHYQPYRTALLQHSNELGTLYQYAKNAAAEHEKVKKQLIQNQSQVHAKIASIRQQLQEDIVKANLRDLLNDAINPVNFDRNWYEVGGWHTASDYQGINESDARKKSAQKLQQGEKDERPFTIKNSQESYRLLQELAQQNAFLHTRDWTLKSKICPTVNSLTRTGNTRLFADSNFSNFYWQAQDTLAWSPLGMSGKISTSSIPSTACKALPRIVIGHHSVNNETWKLTPLATLHTLSSTSATTSLPYHSYRMRTQYAYSFSPLPLSLGKDTSFNKNANDPLHKNFRTDVEVHFIHPSTGKEKQGDLLHPYWQPRLKESKKESGQALLETLLVLLVCVALLSGLSVIGSTFKKVHQALVNSRHLAFQTAYQKEWPSDLTTPYLLTPKADLADILKPAAVSSFSSEDLPNDSLWLSTMTDTTLSKNLPEKIQRHTTLLIDSYADKRRDRDLRTTMSILLDTDMHTPPFSPILAHDAQIEQTKLNQLLQAVEVKITPPTWIGSTTKN